MKTYGKKILSIFLSWSLLFSTMFSALPVYQAKAVTGFLLESPIPSNDTEASVFFAQGNQKFPIYTLTFSEAESDETLTSIKIRFFDYLETGAVWTDSSASSSLLADLATDATSGVLLYKDNASAGTVGTFDSEDTLVSLASTPTYSSDTFTIIPAALLEIVTGDVYHIVLQTKETVPENQEFSVAIQQDDVITSGTNPVIPETLPTSPIRVDTDAPLLKMAFVHPDMSGQDKEATLFFSEPLKTSTVECTDTSSCASLYTISGGISVVSASAFLMGDDTDMSDEVLLTFDAVAENNVHTLTIADTLTDMAGNALDTNDFPFTFTENFPPMVKGVRKHSNDALIIEFSKEMSRSTTEGGALFTDAYQLTIDGSPLTGFAVSLDSTGKILTLSKTGAFATAGAGNDDFVFVSYSIADVGGMPLQGMSDFIVDATLPKVQGLIKEVGNIENVWITFSEPVEKMTAEMILNYVDDSTVSPSQAELVWYEPGISPSWMTHTMNERVVKLSFTDISALNTKITVSNIKDFAGNIVDPSANTALLNAGDPISLASVSADMTKGSWNSFLDGCKESFGNTGNYDNGEVNETNSCFPLSDNGNRDTLVLTFSGSLDTASFGMNSAGIISNIGSFIEVYDEWKYGSVSTDCGGADQYVASNPEGQRCVGRHFAFLDQSYGKISSNGGTNNVLTVYLQGFTDVFTGMTVKPKGIKGMNGLTAIQNATPENNRIPMPVFAQVEFVKVDKSQGTGSIIDAGDTVDIYFSEAIDTTGLTAENVNRVLLPTQMFPWEEHVWASPGDPVLTWNLINEDPAGGALSGRVANSIVRITLGTGTTVQEGDEIMIMGLNSASGTPLSFGGIIDASAPTLTKGMWKGDTKELFLQYSEELKDISGDGLATHGIVFTDSSTGGVDISSVEKISDCDSSGTSAGTMECPFTKIKITFSGVIENTDALDFSSANIIDRGGFVLPNIMNITVSNYSDTTPPVIYRGIQNDWDNNGVLNAWDELILVFDGDSGTEGLQPSDIDYSTITDINTQFIVKRADQIVSNAFGQGVNFWVDQWEEHKGELHINLGQGANIEAGDEIWGAENSIKDFAGNALDHTVSQITLSSSQGGEIETIKYTDTNTNTQIDLGDVFTVVFNTAIDPNTLGQYDGVTTVTNVDWGLPIEHNFEANYGSSYDPSVFKTWGNATGEWNGTFTELTLTLDTGFALGDNDLVQAWSVKTAEGGSIRKPGIIDTRAPVLKEVFGNTSLWDTGDQLTFVFSEPMDETSFTLDTLTTLASELDEDTHGATGNSPINFGTGSAKFLNPEKSVLQITLGDGHNIDNTANFNPASSVKDRNGNADDTQADVLVKVIAIAPATNVSASDNDTSVGGINGNDLTVSFDEAFGATEYKIYILPDFVSLNPAEHNPVMIADTSHCIETSCTLTGSSSLHYDSRTSDASGGIDASKPFFPFNDFERYDVYVLSSDGTDYSFPSKSVTPLQFTLEYILDGNAPKIEGTMPFDGALDIPLNSKTISVKFNKDMDRSSLENTGNIVLEKDISSVWTNVPVFVSYNETKRMADITASSNLDANTFYRARITTNVKDKGGNPLGGEFLVHFTTSASSDTTPPKVRTYFFDGMTKTTDIPRNSFSLSVEFNENMDPATFTSKGVTLSPSLAGASMFYDPMYKTLNYIFGEPLAQNTSYTLTLSGVYLKDSAGNTLDGDGNGTASGATSDNYTLSFTTDEDLSTNRPQIHWIDSNSKSILVGFNEKMDKTKTEKPSNWTLKQGTSVIDVQTASFFYDGFLNELRIEGVSLTPEQPYTLKPNSSVLALNGQNVDTTDTVNNHFEFTPWSEDTVFNADYIASMSDGISGMTGAFDGDMFAKMANENVSEDLDFKMFMPISVWPLNQTSGQTTSYHINFPTTQKIIHGGKIILQFPSSFDVSGAALATDGASKLFFFNQDINGPGGTMTAGSTFNPNGRVQISNVSSNNQTKTVTLTLAVDDGTGCTLDASGVFEASCTNDNTTSTTMPYDFLDFELSGIKNGSASKIDWMNNTGGYQVEISTKNDTGKTLEGPIKSMRFDIKKAGNGSISGTVTASDGVTPVSSAKVFLDSPLAGHLETTSDADGNYSFASLPVAQSENVWDGWYNIWVEAPSSSDTYFGGQGFQIQLTADSSTSSGNNVKLKSASHTMNLTFTYDASLEGQEVLLWATGPTGWKEKKITLSDNTGGSFTDNDETFKVASGSWDFGVVPYYENNVFSKGITEQNFIPPKPQRKDVSGSGSLTFALTTTAQTISGVVQDNSGAGLANVNVYAYSPQGTGGSANAVTTTNGSYTLKVNAGTYIVGAFKPGLPAIPEKTITVTDSHVTDIDFIIQKASSSISGKVTDGTNAIQYASVNAWTADGKFAWASTDTQGEYSLFLEPGTWNIEVFAPAYGMVGSENNVSVATDASVIKNFSVASNTYYTISGQVRDGNGTGFANIFVRAEEVNYNGGNIGNFVGNKNEVKTDSNGNYTLKVKASTAGTGASSSRYMIRAWSPEYGDINPASSTPLDMSSANSTGNNFTLPTKHTLTVSLLNGDDLEKGDIDIQEAFVDIFSETDFIGNHKRLKDINLSAGDNTSAGTIDVPQAGGYKAMMHIPGVGEFTGTVSGNTSFSVTGNTTVQFDLGLDSGTSVFTFSGTVTDSTDPLENVWINVTNNQTLEKFGVSSASDGTFSLKVPARKGGTEYTYTLRGDKPGYKSPEKQTLSATNEALSLAMTVASSTLTGTVYASNGSTPVPYAFVWAEESNGDGFVGEKADNNGQYSLSVPASTSWKLFAKDEQGNKGLLMSSRSAGSSGNNISLTEEVRGKNFISQQAKVENLTPSEGGTLDDTDNTGVKMNVPANALGTGSNPGKLVVKETAAIPKTAQIEPLGGVAKEITATNSSGGAITNLNSDVTVNLVYTKEKIEAFAEVDNTASENGLEELTKLQNSYWDPTLQTWVNLPTTKTVKVKHADAETSWTAIDYTTFVANVTGSGANPSGDNGTASEYYADYQITFASTVDHFTIFGTTNPTDETAPDTPNAPSSTASNGSVALTWTYTEPEDFLEYQVFRGTTSGFTCNDDSQINVSAVTAKSYTDSTPSADTTYTYYYKITAVDTSGNISSCSSAEEATYTYTAPRSSSGGGGGGSAPANTSPFKLATSVSDATVTLENRNLDLSSVEGKITRPVEITSSVSTVKIAKETQVTYKDGTPFSGEITAPKTVAVSSRPQVPAGFTAARVIQVGAKDEKSIQFDTPITLEIPVSFSKEVNPEQVKAYYFDTETEAYVLAGDGGTLSEDQKTITVEVDHMTIFAALYQEEPTSGAYIFSEADAESGLLIAPAPFSAQFTDTENHWGKQYIHALTAQGVFKNQEKFRPDDFIVRAELIKILGEVFDIEREEYITESRFTDVDINQWYASYIEAAALQGVVKGYSDNTFRPGKTVNRAEALKMILEASGHTISENVTEEFDDVSSNDWFSSYVSFASLKGIVKGKSPRMFAPSENITRAEIAKIVSLTQAIE